MSESPEDGFLPSEIVEAVGDGGMLPMAINTQELPLYGGEGTTETPAPFYFGSRERSETEASGPMLFVARQHTSDPYNGQGFDNFDNSYGTSLNDDDFDDIFA